MKKLLLLLIFPFFLACSSDNDDDGKIPEGEKIAVTESEILGSWEYMESDNVRYSLTFNSDDITSHYITYYNDKMIRNRVQIFD